MVKSVTMVISNKILSKGDTACSKSGVWKGIEKNEQ